MSQSKVTIRGKISSWIDDLEILHQSYVWLPSSEQIRPTPEILQRKHEACDYILSTWSSFYDYISHTVFGVEIFNNSDNDSNQYNNNNSSSNSSSSNTNTVDQLTRMKVIEKDITKEIRFVPNMFPYQVEGYHYVLWFGCPSQPCSDEEISAIINQYIQSTFPDTIHSDKSEKEGDYDFAWYVDDLS